MTRCLVVALALAVAAAALTGCGSNERSNGTTSFEAVPSATVETTATTTGGDSAAGAGTTAPGEIDQADLQAELEAIERELDAMTLPDDADFGDIESALQ